MFKKILINIYKISNAEKELIMNFCKISNKKYSNQNKYVATNAIGEFSINYEKILEPKKMPSRANLTPLKNSIIISKLLGENKVFFVKNDFFVFSTGFLNISTEYIDHFMGFLLSGDFKKQKNMLSSGTTMIGLNKTNFERIFIKKPWKQEDKFSNFILKLINFEKEIKMLKNKLINLLIK